MPSPSGCFRKYLVENFGLTAARTVLTQFGFAHGWRMAEAMQSGVLNGTATKTGARAGPRIHTLEDSFAATHGAWIHRPEGASMLLGSYEAEQHLLHFGRSDVPACWTICGLR